jgi:seryl-tRNA synthetase
MLDLRFVCDNIDLVKDKLAKRNSKLDLAELTSLAAERRETIHKGGSSESGEEQSERAYCGMQTQ